MTTIDTTVDWRRVGKDARTVINELLGAKKFRYMGEYSSLSKDHVYTLKMGLTDELVINDETNRENTYHLPSHLLKDFWEIK